MEKLTHYRKVFKSDHLGSSDLEDMIEEKKSLIFTIKEVKQEIGATVAGKKLNCNIAYFVEPIKPMVLNATNSKIIRTFAPERSPFVEKWCNIIIELYIDENVKMKGDIVSGVRVRPVQPKVKTKPLFTETNFKGAFEKKVTVAQIKSIYELTPEMEAKFLNYGK